MRIKSESSVNDSFVIEKESMNQLQEKIYKHRAEFGWIMKYFRVTSFLGELEVRIRGCNSR